MQIPRTIRNKLTQFWTRYKRMVYMEKQHVDEGGVHVLYVKKGTKILLHAVIRYTLSIQFKSNL